MTNIKEFKHLLQLKQEELHDYLCEIVPSYYNEDKIIDQYGSFLYCQGDIPVLMVAHLDTVHKAPPKSIFFDQEEKIMWSPDGIGGDDRCGVWSILEILDKGLRPSIVFTWNEEVGALGASDFCTLLKKEDLAHINFAIEIDRRGNMDCVFYDLESPEFESFIEEFNFKSAWGSFSDISTICPHFGFAGVNLSAGYFNEHTFQEHIDIMGMEYTIERASKILQDERVNSRWEWKEADRKNYYGKYSYAAYGYGGYGDDISYEDWYYGYNKTSKKTGTKAGIEEALTDSKTLDWCVSCQNLTEEKNMAPRPYDDMCLECYNKLNVEEEYCQSCGDLTKISDMADFPNEMICKKCYKELTSWNEETNNKDIYCEVCHIIDKEQQMFELNGKLVCRECYEEFFKKHQ